MITATMTGTGLNGLFSCDRCGIVGLLTLTLFQNDFLTKFRSRKAEDQTALSNYVSRILDVSGLPAEVEEGLILNDNQLDGLHLSNLYAVSDERLVADRQFVVSSSCSGTQRVSFLALGVSWNINI